MTTVRMEKKLLPLEEDEEPEKAKASILDFFWGMGTVTIKDSKCFRSPP